MKENHRLLFHFSFRKTNLILYINIENVNNIDSTSIRKSHSSVKHTHALNYIYRNRKIVETFLIYEINDEFQALKVQFDEREITLEISNSR